MRPGLALIGSLSISLHPAPSHADQLRPLTGPIYKDELGLFTVAVPPGALPCIQTSDRNGGLKTLVLFLDGKTNPCPEVRDIDPRGLQHTSWFKKNEPYTLITVNATAYRRLLQIRPRQAVMPRDIALANCGSSNRNKTKTDMDSPFKFGDLQGAACILLRDWGRSYWTGTFHRYWDDPASADHDDQGRALPWVEYEVALYGPEKGFDYHYRTLEQVFKSITLIPASSDAARHW